MKDKKIAIIGVGCRTGTMFAFELKDIADILGVGREINKTITVKKKENDLIPLDCKIISDLQWPKESFQPDIIFLAIRNPVAPAIKYYYQKSKEHNVFPVLVLSQNGIKAGEEAIDALKDILGPEFKKIKIIRLSLFNPIDRQEDNKTIKINYSLPVRVSFGMISGPGELNDIKSLFDKAGFESVEFKREEIKNMEFSKLFFNLIGIASASRELSIQEGFEEKESFEEEIEVLKEYIKTVKAFGGEFVNFPHYPVKTISLLIEILPIKLLLPFRKSLAKIVARGREGKPKDLREINYYNGAVMNLGKKTGVPTPINKKVLARILKGQ